MGDRENTICVLCYDQFPSNIIGRNWSLKGKLIEFCRFLNKAPSNKNGAKYSDKQLQLLQNSLLSFDSLLESTGLSVCGDCEQHVELVLASSSRAEEIEAMVSQLQLQLAEQLKALKDELDVVHGQLGRVEGKVKGSDQICLLQRMMAGVGVRPLENGVEALMGEVDQKTQENVEKVLLVRRRIVEVTGGLREHRSNLNGKINVGRRERDGQNEEIPPPQYPSSSGGSRGGGGGGLLRNANQGPDPPPPPPPLEVGNNYEIVVEEQNVKVEVVPAEPEGLDDYLDEDHVDTDAEEEDVSVNGNDSDAASSSSSGTMLSDENQTTKRRPGRPRRLNRPLSTEEVEQAQLRFSLKQLETWKEPLLPEVNLTPGIGLRKRHVPVTSEEELKRKESLKRKKSQSQERGLNAVDNQNQEQPGPSNANRPDPGPSPGPSHQNMPKTTEQEQMATTSANSGSGNQESAQRVRSKSGRLVGPPRSLVEYEVFGLTANSVKSKVDENGKEMRNGINGGGGGADLDRSTENNVTDPQTPNHRQRQRQKLIERKKGG